MASPALAVAQVNGIASASREGSPMSVASTSKRKRDLSDDGTPEVNGKDENKPVVNGVHKSADSKEFLRDYLDVLRSYDTHTSLLKRPLPETHSQDEPDAKRKKSEDLTAASAIVDKATNNEYKTLEDIVSDVILVVDAYTSSLQSAGSDDAAAVDDAAIARALRFKTKALDLLRQERQYPDASGDRAKYFNGRNAASAVDTGAPVLTLIGNAPQAKPLFSSLQQRDSTPDGGDSPAKALVESTLPPGISITRVVPTPPNAGDKGARSLTLGELFPSPRGLPPLAAPKSKATTKSNNLSFYHPELMEKSKYRSGSYFTQEVTYGDWLDYSRSTPASQVKTKQRERAQSLAGHKPSSADLEVSEMENLFRGAFSSFAPSKDDSAAIIPAGQRSSIWYHRVGRRNLERMIDLELQDDDAADSNEAEPIFHMEIDEEEIEEALEKWDEHMVDPSLEDVMGKKDDHDKDTEEILQEISDLIETLSSYQRNRNLTLPTSQDRYSTDPVNPDMLRNGALSHQPSEEEMMTYETLKAQLSLIIQTLPPYAVARLNSDKLRELNVSTKIEVRVPVYKGIMEEDEPAARARQAKELQNTANQRASHRQASVSGGTPYANAQFSASYGQPSRSPMPNTPYYQQQPQTPMRAQATPMYSQRPPSAVPVPTPYANQNRQPQQNPAYRAQMNGHVPAGLAKTQGPYGYAGAAGTPGQPRAGPPYQNMSQAGSPNQRFGPGYPASFPQHQQMHAQQQQHAQHHAQAAGYSPYSNGAASMAARNMGQQVTGGQPLNYQQSPTPPQHHQQIPQRAPQQPQQHPGTPSYPMGPNMLAMGIPGGSPAMGSRTPSAGWGAAMPASAAHQQRVAAMQQQQANVNARRAMTDKVVGLAGIGLGPDPNKMAAVRVNMPTAVMGGPAPSMSPSPKPQQMHVPGGIPTAGPSPVSMHNGIVPPPSASPASMPASSVSPAPGQVFQVPPA